MANLQRLNKYLADCGICSRRKADELIDAGRILVNGKKVFELGARVDSSKDAIVVDGKKIQTQNRDQKVYYAFNKPKGVLSTVTDPLERETVMDFFKNNPYRIYPVGRLDYESEGLLLLTNDGEFTQKVTHPEGEVTKTYIAKISSDLSEHQIQRLLLGVTIPHGRVKAISIRKIQRGRKTHPWYQLVINEGKNRQIREMFLKVGKDTMKLQRIAIGKLRLGSLDKGKWKKLSTLELRKVFQTDVFEVKGVSARPSERRSARLNERSSARPGERSSARPRLAASPHKTRRRSDKRNPGKIPMAFIE